MPFDEEVLLRIAGQLDSSVARSVDAAEKQLNRLTARANQPAVKVGGFDASTITRGAAATAAAASRVSSASKRAAVDVSTMSKAVVGASRSFTTLAVSQGKFFHFGRQVIDISKKIDSSIRLVGRGSTAAAQGMTSVTRGAIGMSRAFSGAGGEIKLLSAGQTRFVATSTRVIDVLNDVTQGTVLASSGTTHLGEEYGRMGALVLRGNVGLVKHREVLEASAAASQGAAKATAAHSTAQGAGIPLLNNYTNSINSQNDSLKLSEIRHREGVAGVIALFRAQAKFVAAGFILFGLLGAIGTVIGRNIELSKDLARVQTVLSDTTTDLTAQQSQLREVITRTSSELGVSTHDVSEALFQLGSAGLDAKTAIAGLEPVLNLAVGTTADFGDTAKTVAGVFRVFGQNMDSTLDTTEKFAQITDVLAVAFRDSLVETEDLIQGLKFAGNSAATAGLEFNEIVSVLAVLNNRMIQTGFAGRATRGAFAEIVKESAKLEDQLGVTFQAGNFESTLVGLEKIRDLLEDNATSVRTQAVLFQIFDREVAPGVIALANGIDELREEIVRTGDAAKGTAERFRAIQESSLSAQINKFRESLINLAANGFQPIFAAVKNFLEIFNPLFRIIIDVDKSLGGFGASIVAMAAAFKTAQAALAFVTPALRTLTVTRAQEIAINEAAIASEEALAAVRNQERLVIEAQRQAEAALKAEKFAGTAVTEKQIQNSAKRQAILNAETQALIAAKVAANEAAAGQQALVATANAGAAAFAKLGFGLFGVVSTIGALKEGNLAMAAVLTATTIPALLGTGAAVKQVGAAISTLIKVHPELFVLGVIAAQVALAFYALRKAQEQVAAVAAAQVKTIDLESKARKTQIEQLQVLRQAIVDNDQVRIQELANVTKSTNLNVRQLEAFQDLGRARQADIRAIEARIAALKREQEAQARPRAQAVLTAHPKEVGEINKLIDTIKRLDESRRNSRERIDEERQKIASLTAEREKEIAANGKGTTAARILGGAIERQTIALTENEVAVGKATAAMTARGAELAQAFKDAPEVSEAFLTVSRGILVTLPEEGKAFLNLANSTKAATKEAQDKAEADAVLLGVTSRLTEMIDVNVQAQEAQADVLLKVAQASRENAISAAQSAAAFAKINTGSAAKQAEAEITAIQAVKQAREEEIADEIQNVQKLSRIRSEAIEERAAVDRRTSDQQVQADAQAQAEILSLNIENSQKLFELEQKRVDVNRDALNQIRTQTQQAAQDRINAERDVFEAERNFANLRQDLNRKKMTEEEKYDNLISTIKKNLKEVGNVNLFDPAGIDKANIALQEAQKLLSQLPEEVKDANGKILVSSVDATEAQEDLAKRIALAQVNLAKARRDDAIASEKQGKAATDAAQLALDGAVDGLQKAEKSVNDATRTIPDAFLALFSQLPGASAQFAAVGDAIDEAFRDVGIPATEAQITKVEELILRLKEAQGLQNQTGTGGGGTGPGSFFGGSQPRGDGDIVMRPQRPLEYNLPPESHLYYGAEIMEGLRTRQIPKDVFRRQGDRDSSSDSGSGDTFVLNVPPEFLQALVNASDEQWREALKRLGKVVREDASRSRGRKIS